MAVEFGEAQILERQSAQLSQRRCGADPARGDLLKNFADLTLRSSPPRVLGTQRPGQMQHQLAHRARVASASP